VDVPDRSDPNHSTGLGHGAQFSLRRPWLR
jgi:hypothetical protein